jgi:hypothetical protein
LAVQADGVADFAQKWRNSSLWRSPKAVGRLTRGARKSILPTGMVENSFSFAGDAACSRSAPDFLEE